jgi:hypothetical protein
MTYWFDRRPGQVVMSSHDHTLCWDERRRHAGMDHFLDEGEVLFADIASADWVKTPAELGAKLGGVRLRVKDVFAAPCPTCKTTSATFSYVDSDLFTAECRKCSTFIWYQFKSKEKEKVNKQ